MRKSTSAVLQIALFAGLLFAFSTAAMADDDDPPGRVARLNYMQGSISFQPAGENDWVQANPNRPLTAGDNLWVAENSRGELHIDSTAIRLASQTGITFLTLDDRTVQIQLAQGSLNAHVRRLDGGDAFEIDTPNLAFTIQRPGEYRVDVDPDGNTTVVTIRDGEGDVTGGGSEFHLDSGDSDSFSGTDTLTYDGGSAGGPDEFDQWCSARDDREERALSARYVSRDVIGYEDLDEYGDWRDVPDYGYAWFPSRVEAGWAPYRMGHWVWIDPWGWTWVDDEPWGFAPFHYGRWAMAGGGWCWVPGPIVVRPVYAPALVVFMGGPRFGVSVSFGGGPGVGWFPLGPREVYVPTYRTSARYVQRINITNTTVNVVNVTNVYNNRDNSRISYMYRNNVGAVTAVSRDTFVNARPVNRAAVRINQQQLQGATLQRGAPIAPVRQSVIGTGTATSVRPPERVLNRQVVVKETPAPAPVPFQRRQQVLSAQPGTPATRQQMDQMRQQQQTEQMRGQQKQQQTNIRSAPPVQPNPPQQQERGQAQPQPGQAREPQIQQQPTGKFTPPPARTNPSPQQERGQAQPQPRQSQVPQIQQQPTGKITPPPARTNPSPQQERGQAQPQPGQSQGTQMQQRPDVRYAPPARVNENTYHPHQFERPQNAPRENAAPPKSRNEQPAPKSSGRDDQRGKDSNKQGK
ncbi:MAG: DUF6600 domain-containing protein [Candidatus Acidiferrales bacterium]